MSKRSAQEEEERLRKKFRHYEKKLARITQQVPPKPPGLSLENLEDDVEPEERLQDVEFDWPLNQGDFSVGQYGNEHDETGQLETPYTSVYDLDCSSSGSETTTADRKQNDVPPPVADPGLLEALGDKHLDTPEWGDDILEDISQRWEPILRNGLKKDVKDDLNKKYLFPKNCPSSKAPTLNPEIAAVLTESSRSRDSRVQNKQNQLGRVVTALGRAITGVITKSMESNELVQILNDASKLICDSHHLESETRRSLIAPVLDKTYATSFKDRKRDGFLFGDNLGEFIKSSRGIQKTGQLITPPAPSTSYLNSKGPQRRPQQRNMRPHQSRGGGTQRAPPPGSRRYAPPPPPPAQSARRPPPPPPQRPAYNSNYRRGPATSRARNAT